MGEYDLYEGPCEAGCNRFHGGEVRHHRDCGHYPQSLTKVFEDRIADLERQLAEARARSTSVPEAAKVLLAALEADPSLEQAAPWRDWEEGWHCISALSGETQLAEAQASSPSVEEAAKDEGFFEGYKLVWIAGARPPAHPEKMQGTQTFPSYEDAMAFFDNLAEDAEFVSLHRKVTTISDITSRALRALGETQP